MKHGVQTSLQWDQVFISSCILNTRTSVYICIIAFPNTNVSMGAVLRTTPVRFLYDHIVYIIAGKLSTNDKNCFQAKRGRRYSHPGWWREGDQKTFIKREAAA